MHPGDESPAEVTGTTLEELERFRQDIERYRARRKAVSEEFEGFVRGFKTPAALAAPHPQAHRPVPPKPAPPAPALIAAPAVNAAVEPDTAAEGISDPPTRRSWLPLAIVAALVVALAIWQFGRTGSDTPPAEAPAADAAAPPAVSPAPAPVATPTAPPDPSESVLTTTRAVWLRVTADGNRIVSRELPAGARVPFRADRSIEIRAGDAGAVRLSIGGRDQGALGTDGAVVTRSFTVPR